MAALNISFLTVLLLLYTASASYGPPWQDASDVTWTRKVDTQLLLEDALRRPYTFLVGQITLGRVIGANKDSDPEPIMANAVATTDITFEEWIDCVIAAGSGKGVKLKFSHYGAVLPALQTLASRRSKLNFPVWLHADLLDGPVNTTIPSVAADWFLSLCQHHLPTAILSLGWVTSFEMYRTPFYAGYSWRDVTKMADIVRCQNVTQPVSFSIRGVFVRDSLLQLRWLTEVVSNSSLTVWGSIMDLVLVQDLLLLRQALPKSKVFYDLPSWTMEEFLRKRNSVDYLLPVKTFNNRKWIENSSLDFLLISDVDECRQLPKIYVSNDVIVFNDVRGSTVLLFTDRFRLPVTIRGVLSPFELRNRRYPAEPWITNSFSLFWVNATGLQTLVHNMSGPESDQTLSEAGKMTYWTIGDLPFSDCTFRIEFVIGVNGMFCNKTPSCFVNFSDGFGCQRSLYPQNNERGVAIGMVVRGVRGWIFSEVDIIGETLGCRKTFETNTVLAFLTVAVMVLS